jgi:6-phosphogluconolactonase
LSMPPVVRDVDPCLAGQKPEHLERTMPGPRLCRRPAAETSACSERFRVFGSPPSARTFLRLTLRAQSRSGAAPCHFPWVVFPGYSASNMTLWDRIDLHQFSTPDALARAVAGHWLTATPPEFRHVALSGGRIARLFLLAVADLARENAPFVRRLRDTHFFWADERCVPPDHSESNFRLAQEALFERLSIPSDCIHRLQGELEPGLAVSAANSEVVRTVPLNPAGLPVFDLVFLGMGEDGHIASLFPDGPALTATSVSPYATVIGPKPPNPRITLTYPILAAAREAWVLISGDRKESILHNSLEDKAFTPLNRLLHLRKASSLWVDRFFLNERPHGKVETAGK